MVPELTSVSQSVPPAAGSVPSPEDLFSFSALWSPEMGGEMLSRAKYWSSMQGGEETSA